MAKRHYLSNRFDSFNIDDLNWTVWIRIDWYVEVDSTKKRHFTVLSLFTLFIFTKTNLFLAIWGETITTSWSITESIFKYPIFRWLDDRHWRSAEKWEKWNRSEFFEVFSCWFESDENCFSCNFRRLAKEWVVRKNDKSSSRAELPE